MTPPLRWCLDWAQPSFTERFLMGSPVGATEDRARADIVRQLQARTAADLAAWDPYPAAVRRLAGELSARLVAAGVWPSPRFLPDDPADIPLGSRLGETDKWDFWPAAYAIVEKELGIRMGSVFWDGLPGMTYAAALEQLVSQPGAPTGQRHGAGGAAARR